MRGDVNWLALLGHGGYQELPESAIFATVLANGGKFFTIVLTRLGAVAIVRPLATRQVI